jgi:hypothetical protein
VASRPEVGSSRKRTAGLATSSIAMFTWGPQGQGSQGSK